MNFAIIDGCCCVVHMCTGHLLRNTKKPLRSKRRWSWRTAAAENWISNSFAYVDRHLFLFHEFTFCFQFYIHTICLIKLPMPGTFQFQRNVNKHEKKATQEGKSRVLLFASLFIFASNLMFNRPRNCIIEITNGTVLSQTTCVE